LMYSTCKHITRTMSVKRCCSLACSNVDCLWSVAAAMYLSHVSQPKYFSTCKLHCALCATGIAVTARASCARALQQQKQLQRCHVYGQYSLDSPRQDRHLWQTKWPAKYKAQEPHKGTDVVQSAVQSLQDASSVQHHCGASCARTVM